METTELLTKKKKNEWNLFVASASENINAQLKNSHLRVSSKKFMFSVAFGKTIKFAYFNQNIENASFFHFTNQETELIKPVL